jgi:uncharacterized OB-fold protein
VTEGTYGDPTMRPYWEAARRRQLAAQHCRICGTWQLYARPFCLACGSDDVVWEATSGLGTIYSMTTVHRKVVADLDPPYKVAIVELDEGPRLATNVEGNACAIGARVEVIWRERDGGLPPVPVFRGPDG